MFRTLISRLGAGLIAATLVVGGSLLAAAPATAAVGDETLVLANSTYTAGNWGEGISFTGENFTPGATVSVWVAISHPDLPKSGVLASQEVVADAAGAISGSFAPTDIEPVAPLAEGERVDLVAVYEVSNGTSGAFAEITILPFVPNAQTVTVDPICLSGDAARDPGVMIGATGFGQFEEGITYSVVDAAGTPVQGAEGQTLTADETGSLAPQPLTLYSTAGNIPDGQYTITFVGSVTTAGVFQVGPCDAPATPGAVEPAAVEPAAVVSAAPQLANTGSSDTGLLVSGSALLLLVGAALVAARRRTASA
jgi:LPXTG-motif cell wall-anchored protein